MEKKRAKAKEVNQIVAFLRRTFRHCVCDSFISVATAQMQLSFNRFMFAQTY